MIFDKIKLNFEDVNQDILLICAFRYALGRRTYVVGSIAEIIRDNWSRMSEPRKAFYKQEIREAIRDGCAGHPKIDVPEWESILALPGGDSS